MSAIDPTPNQIQPSTPLSDSIRVRTTSASVPPEPFGFRSRVQDGDDSEITAATTRRPLFPAQEDGGRVAMTLTPGSGADPKKLLAAAQAFLGDRVNVSLSEPHHLPNQGGDHSDLGMTLSEPLLSMRDDNSSHAQALSTVIAQAENSAVEEETPLARVIRLSGQQVRPLEFVNIDGQGAGERMASLLRGGDPAEPGKKPKPTSPR